MGHSVEAVVEELGCELKDVEPWLALARGKIPDDGLTDHLAASIGAAVTLGRTWRKPGTELDRFFVKLAFYAEPKSNWIVLRLPRRPAQLIDRADVDKYRAPEKGYAAFFDSKPFLKGLKRR